mgnify:FL=1
MGAPFGNKNAEKAKRFQKAMERVLARKYGDVDTGYEAIAKIYIEIAEAKDPNLLKDFADRVDGKPRQQIEAVDDEGRVLAIGLVAYQPAAINNPASLPAAPVSTPGTPET